jgi:hypothetical protein
MSAGSVLIDTGLRLAVAGERYGVIRCSNDAAPCSLVREDRIVMGEELGYPECLEPHRLQLLEDAIAFGTVGLDEEGVSLGFSEIIGTVTASLRNQLRRKSSRRTASAA